MAIASINDPRELNFGWPWIVFANNTIQIVAESIDLITDIPGLKPFNHAMLSIDQGEFVAQNMTLLNSYRKVPMEKYMVKGEQLAFVQLVNNNPDFLNAFSKSVQQRLARPGWENSYDFLGIFGQFIHQDWVHTPGLEYCSVDVIRHLVNACPHLPKEDQQVINNIPRETNPEALWQIVVNNPKTFSLYGIYDYSTGIHA